MSKARNEKYNRIAEKLEENKDKFKEFLIKQNWTIADMSGEWGTDENNDHVFGHITDNRLANTNGIKINPYLEDVYITFYNEDGDNVGSYIYSD